MNLDINVSEVTKAWFAGFYEGEGSIYANDRNNYRIRLSICQNDSSPLYEGQSYWGGNIYKRVRKSPASDKICTCHYWNLNHTSSMKFIEDIKPYMRIPYKIEQMDNALNCFKTLQNSKFYCKFCNNEFSNLPSKSRHEKQQHIEKERIFKCNTCNKEYKSQGTLNRHIKEKHIEKDRVFECPICCKIFHTKNTLNSHIRIIHIDKDKFYTCENCNHQYSSKDSLRKHKKRHVEKPDASLNC